jgi:nucleotide-binding universal stress UspA family protein
MFDLIVVGHDGGDGGEDSLALASELAFSCGARLVVASVRQGDGPIPAPIALPPGSEVVELEEKPPAAALAELAAERGADLIVVGSSHRGEPGISFLGSTAEDLVHDGRTPVAVATRGLHQADDLRIRVLAVALDASAAAERALAAGGELARACRATIRVFHARPPAPHEGAGRRELVSAATGRLPPETRPIGEELEGHATTVLPDELEKGIDVLLMGSSAKGRLGRALLGGVSVSMMRSAPCPLIVFPSQR